tara:strand:- start:86 stop:643 length:558 start_codon:yes stop_codon:yes gene_type:complete
MHKTVVAAEFMLIHILRRAKQLIQNGERLFGSPALLYFMENNITLTDFKTNPKVLENFAKLDDFDILGAIKVWQENDDKVLSQLSKRLVGRKLFKIEVSKEPFSAERISQIKQKVKENLGLNDNDVEHFVHSDILTNNAYNETKENINLVMKSGKIVDVSLASDNLNISALSKPVEKYFLSYPKL